MKKMMTLGFAALLALAVRGQSAVRDLGDQSAVREAFLGVGQERGAFAGGGRVPGAVMDARPCLSRRAGSGGIRLELTGTYIDSSLLWFVFRCANSSAINFRSGGMRFVIRDRRALKRRALQELRLVPVVRQEAALLRADSTVRLYYGVIPRVPRPRQELMIEWVERNGDRRVQLRVPARILLTAHRL